MGIGGMLGFTENALSGFDDTKSKIEALNIAFDQQLGIMEEEHSTVLSLIETYEDLEEDIIDYDEQINDLNTKMAAVSTASQEYAELLKKRIDTESTKLKAEQQLRRTEGKLGKKGITDIGGAKKAKDDLESGKKSTKKGGAGQMMDSLAALKKNPYVMAADMAIKVIEWGIKKYTEYMKVEYENALRALNAITTVNVNKLNSSLALWTNTAEGAYTAQMDSASSTQEVIKAANENALANRKLADSWFKWIPIVGTILEKDEQEMQLENQIMEARLSNAQKELSKIQEISKRTDEYLKKQDEVIHNYQRMVGLSGPQYANAERFILDDVNKELAKLGKTFEDGIKMQTMVFEQSGRTINYSTNDYTKSAAVGMFVGDDNLANFTSEMTLFNKSISDSADIMYDMYKDASKMGLSSQKLTKTVLSNLKLAEKFGFKNGVKGFMELSKWSENVRFNLSSLESALNKTFDNGLEGVITQSAQLQVLGGNFAAMSDPLGMMYDSLSDAESFAKRIYESIEGIGTTNQKTGETTFSGQERYMLDAAAKGWGMSREELMNMRREAGKKEVVLSQMDSSPLSKEQKDAVANKAQRDSKTGKWYVNTISGERIDVNAVKSQSQIDEILSGNNTEDAVQYAKETMSKTQEIASVTAQINQQLGTLTHQNWAENIDKINSETLEKYKENQEEIVNAIVAIRNDATEKASEQLNGLATVATDTQTALQTLQEYSEHAANALRELEAAWKKVKDKIDEKEHKKAIAKQQAEYIQYTNQHGIPPRVKFKKDENGKAVFDGYDLTPPNGDKNLQGKVAEKLTNDMNRFKNRTAKTNDGISHANGTPMSVSASEVIPVHDGASKTVMTDSKDSALFAKDGGPFDTLFNGVFDKINSVYERLGKTKSVGVGTNTILSNILNNENTSNVYSNNGRYNGNSMLSSILNNSLVSVNNESNRNENEIKSIDSFGNRQSTNIMPLAPIGSSNVIPIENRIGVDRQTPPTSNSNQEISFKPLDINMKGEINLTSGGQSVNIIEQLRNNPLLMRQITEMVLTQISSNINGGKSELFPNRYTIK